MVITSKPKAVLFDWDGTIVDSWSVITAAAFETMSYYGKGDLYLQLTDSKNKHRSTKDMLPEVFGDQWEEVAKHYQANYRKLSQQGIKLLPGAKEVLDLLYQDPEIYLAVISNKLGSYLREEVETLGLKEYFASVVGSLDAEEDKPSALPVLLALQKSDIFASSEVWIIGDSIIDLECAHNSGCSAIYYGEQAWEPDPKVTAPIAVCSSHSELLRILQPFY